MSAKIAADAPDDRRAQRQVQGIRGNVRYCNVADAGGPGDRRHDRDASSDQRGACRALGHPLSAALWSFCVGTVALAVVVLLFARGSTDLGALRSMPLYMLIGGGLLGAVYVLVNLVVAPKIGIAALMALSIAGQLAAALLLDRFGLFDLAQRELSVGRVSGVVLVLVGALMVRML
ncbi:DMT family transporter [Methyloceanibacter stevinii]|uniref:DMT family transporter n=1 Tax=Methyloceanibacter stevinii TaxID=1774970 RepID=UPI00244EA21D|nr:DMT family transporter [Methyloceanibacter stevinii]